MASNLSSGDENSDECDPSPLDDGEVMQLIFEDLEREYQALEEKEDATEVLSQRHDELLNETNLELVNIKSQIKSEKKDLSKLRKEEIQLNADVDNLSKDIETSRKEIKASLEAIEKRCVRLKNMKLDNFREKVKRHIRLLHKIKDSETQLKEIQLDMKQITKDRDQADQMFRSFSDEVVKHAELRRLELLRLDKTRRKVADLELQNNPAFVTPKPGSYEATFAFLSNIEGGFEEFGIDHSELKTKISNFNEFVLQHQDQFKHPPVGPLYSYVQITDKQWAPLVERILQRYLFTYIVDNPNDKTELERLIKSFFNEPKSEERLFAESSPIPTATVIGFGAQYYPFEQRVTGIEGLECESINLMDAVQVDSEWGQLWDIFLADIVRAERIILFHNEHDAFVLMHHQARMSPMSRIVEMAYSLDGFQIFPFPDFKTSVIEIAKHALYMKVHIGESLAYYQKLIEKIESTIESLKSNIDAYRRLQVQTLEIFEQNKLTLEQNQKQESRLQKLILFYKNAIDQTVTIEGEEEKIKTSLSQASILEKSLDKKLNLKKAKEVKLEKLHQKQIEGLQKLEALRNKYKQVDDELDENLTLMEMERVILETQIKAHETCIDKLEAVVLNKLTVTDLNNNEVAAKNLNVSSDELE